MRLSRRAANKEASYQVAQAADIMARRATIATSNPIGPRVFFQRCVFQKCTFQKWSRRRWSLAIQAQLSVTCQPVSLSMHHLPHHHHFCFHLRQTLESNRRKKVKVLQNANCDDEAAMQIGVASVGRSESEVVKESF